MSFTESVDNNLRGTVGDKREPSAILLMLSFEWKQAKPKSTFQQKP